MHARTHLPRLRRAILLGLMLLSWHNIAFYQKVMADLRAAIREKRLAAFMQAFAADQAGGEESEDVA